jgi:hypothetical protein
MRLVTSINPDSERRRRQQQAGQRPQSKECAKIVRDDQARQKRMTKILMSRFDWVPAFSASV